MAETEKKPGVLAGAAAAISRHKVRTAVICVAAAAAIGAGVFFTTAKNKAADATTYSFIRTTTLSRGTLDDTVSVTGTVESAETSTVSYNAGTGSNMKIKTVNVAVGDSVQEGDVIATLDSSDILESIEKEQENLADQKEKAQESYNDAQDSYNDAVADRDEYQSDYNDAKSAYNTARNNYCNAKNTVKTFQSEYDSAYKKEQSKGTEYTKAFANYQAYKDYTNTSALETAMKNAESALEKAQQDKASAEADKAQKETALASAETAKNDAESVMARMSVTDVGYAVAKQAYDDAISAYNSASSAYNDAVTAYDNACTACDNAQTAYDNAVEAYNNSSLAQDAYKAYQDAEDAYKKAQQATTEALQALNQAKQSCNYDTYQQAYNTANQAWEAAQKTMEQYESAVTQAAKTLKNAAKTLEDAGTSDTLENLYDQLDACSLTASTSGKVTALNATVGATPTGTIATIMDTDSLKISVTIEESDINSVSIGMSCRITSDATDGTINGTVTQIDPVSTQSGGFGAEVTVTDTDTGLLIGMNATVEIVLSSTADCYTVPYDAVGNDDDGLGDYVYRSTGGSGVDMTFEKVYVTVGDSNDYYIEISSDDLADGDVIRSTADLTVGAETVDTSDTADFSIQFGGEGGGDMPSGGGDMPSGGGGNGGGMPSGGGNGGGGMPGGN